MRKALTAATAAFAGLVLLALGYRLGSGTWPDMAHVGLWSHGAGSSAPATGTGTEASDAHDGGGDPSMADASDEHRGSHDGGEQSAASPLAPSESKRKLLYYRNPMGLPDTSPVPKKDGMGMDYIPVYEGEDEGGSTVKVSLDKVQRAGVRSDEAHMALIARSIRAPGIARPDERTLVAVTLRADAFIERLYVNETGQHVEAGQPLFRIYSPDMLRALIDYRTSSIAGVISAEQKLETLAVPKSVVALSKSGERVATSFDFPAPASGIVLRKMAVEGSMLKMGEPAFELADLSRIWVIAEVAEQDAGAVEIGAKARVVFRALKGETYEGRVTFVLHELDAAARTAKVRIEIPNPDLKIRHEMYADVEIEGAGATTPRLVVPQSAIIDSGTSKRVLVERGEGLFEPREVETGIRSGGLVEIRSGLTAGERVVTVATFLIDAESNLKAALSAFTRDEGTAPVESSGDTSKPASTPMEMAP